MNGLTLLSCVLMCGVLFAQSFCEAATIKGKISPPGRCQAMRVVNRALLKSYEGKYSIGKAAKSEKAMADAARQGSYNPQTGEFSFSGLLPGTYDIILELGDATLEGVNLKMDFDDQADEPLTDECRQDVLDYIIKSRKDFFENKVRGLYVEGNGKHCKALMERIRDKPFHNDNGDITWRVEIWIFDNRTGAWVPRGRSGVDVVMRQRMKLEQFQKVTHVFDPKLGGLRLKKEDDEVTIDYTIPAKITADMGKVAE